MITKLDVVGLYGDVNLANNNDLLDRLQGEIGLNRIVMGAAVNLSPATRALNPIPPDKGAYGPGTQLTDDDSALQRALENAHRRGIQVHGCFMIYWCMADMAPQHMVHDVAGRRTRMETHDGFVTNYHYDAVGRLSGLTDGADALIVSNHGGRQLDGAESSIRALPHIVDAVGSRIEVHMDGGIRSGQDVLKARALGARGTYIGRAFLYGLGAMGEDGVDKVLQIIHRELDLTMAFCGHTKIETVNQGILLPGTY